jgi:hypothetical protein
MRKVVFMLVGPFAPGLMACSSDDGGDTSGATGATGTGTVST